MSVTLDHRLDLAETNKQTHRHTDKQLDREAERDRKMQTERQRVRETETETQREKEKQSKKMDAVGYLTPDRRMSILAAVVSDGSSIHFLWFLVGGGMWVCWGGGEGGMRAVVCCVGHWI